ncbi:beta-mannosidase [Paenibacillus sp. CAU 1782]
MELNRLWRLQGFDVGQAKPLEMASPGLDDRFWITAAVPGDVHTALMERGLIDHPYFGHNDAKSRWVEDKEWWYRLQFDYELEQGGHERHELVFDGLDTFATVYVNGLEIGKTDNMLMGHHFDVTRVLQNGKNCIAVKFDPLFLHNRDKLQFQWSSYTKERPWLRKAAMNFGWDWGPRMVTSGIWGKVSLKRYSGAKLKNVRVRSTSIEEHKAVVTIDAEVKTYAGKREGLECAVSILDKKGREVASGNALVQKGSAFVELAVDNPELWWTHDLGEPYLYRVETELRSEGGSLDRHSASIGIRSLELQLQEEDGKPSFAFVLNGVRLFAKGANWIPVDHFIGAAPDQRYRDLVKLSVDANMNMLRVWGGGIYEKDVFYESCDELGVLVWQDFAFANALFPDFNRDFMDNVRREVRYNVRRLRNHASLALWCGNNEIDWLYDMKSSGGDITCPFYGETIYHELIPEELAALDGERPYWPSSPFGGNDANDPEIGDRHNWQVWHGSVYPRRMGEAPLLDYSIQGVTFKNYKKDFTLFSSEFGMHASANRYTLEKNIPAGQFYWGSVEMAYRNKDTNHQKGILLMEGYTGIPQNIEEYMNYSMLTQAEGLKYGIEHYRRNKARTSGALIWQLNDSWPGTSWSLIDYELLPKASYFYARKFFAPLLLTLEHEPGEPLKVWVVNDHLNDFNGTVRLEVADFGGESLFAAEFDAKVGGNCAVLIGSVNESEVLGGMDASAVFVTLTASTDKGEALDELTNIYYLRDHKELQLPVAQLEFSVDTVEQTVTVKAMKGLARLVKLELPLGNVRFSDNFFDLAAGQQKTIHLSLPGGEEQRIAEVRVSAINS